MSQNLLLVTYPLSLIPGLLPIAPTVVSDQWYEGTRPKILGLEALLFSSNADEHLCFLIGAYRDHHSAADL